MSKDTDLRPTGLAASLLSRPDFDPRAVKQDFPIFANNPGLVFLDTAASAQKPQEVIDAVANFYTHDYANVHRGVYALSQRATDHFEAARLAAQRFLNARHASEIVFVRGATEAINLVAQSWGPWALKPGDEIIVTEFEHHSNIVPWQMLRDRLGVELLVAPMDPTGGLDLPRFEALLGPRTRLVALTHVANATGAVLPVEAVIRRAHERGALVLIDGCQAAPRMPVDVQALGCDFYVFSGHKTYGPSGIGVLWGRAALLDAMPPWQGGGDMILQVTFEHTTYQDSPHKFEAGTPDMTGAHGLAVALDYMDRLGRDAILAHEERLTEYGAARLAGIDGVTVIGAGNRRVGVLSFEVDDVHPHDLATILDRHQVAVRAGHHCAQPLMDRLGVAATARASFGIYNDEADIDALIAAIEAAQELFPAMIDLRDLYQDIILDHGRTPRNFRAQEHASHTAQGHNPLCGDRVTVYLTVEGDRIADASFEGRGCAISTASSSLMTEVLRGKTLAEARQLFQAFHAGVTGGAAPALDDVLVDDFERLAPLEGVKAYPARVKCATLAWHAVEAALASGGTAPEPVKTE